MRSNDAGRVPAPCAGTTAGRQRPQDAGALQKHDHDGPAGERRTAQEARRRKDHPGPGEGLGPRLEQHHRRQHHHEHRAHRGAEEAHDVRDVRHRDGHGHVHGEAEGREREAQGLALPPLGGARRLRDLLVGRQQRLGLRRRRLLDQDPLQRAHRGQHVRGDAHKDREGEQRPAGGDDAGRAVVREDVRSRGGEEGEVAPSGDQGVEDHFHGHDAQVDLGDARVGGALQL
mmetsp:Transcript_65826/g.212340  ORF Transcript_65826/g.212340 Transcript_65826/m.212340 type:complete len:230 (+) Transcript_65826:75-764(+)